MSKLTKTTSPIKLFYYNYVTLQFIHLFTFGKKIANRAVLCRTVALTYNIPLESLRFLAIL